MNATDDKSVFDNHTTCNYNNVYDKCVSNLNERWKLGMTLKPKLRTYIKFKEQFETEQNLKFCVSRHRRCAQFRMGVLPVATETARLKSIPVEERMCVLCSDTEDEMHMLCTCICINI